MGNILSTKWKNNAEIWTQTARNAKFGCLFGFMFTLWKFRKSILKLVHFQKNINKIHPKKNENSKQCIHNADILKKMLVYFIKFPLFIASFSILFKKLIRMNYISTSMGINLSSLPKQKYSISFMSFLLAYFIQQNANIFHWKWSLLLLIRSAYSLLRLNIPAQYKRIKMEHINSLAFCLQCILAQQYAYAMPSGLISTYNSVNPTNYNQKQYVSVYSHHHATMPTCTSSVSFHQHKNETNCLKAFLKDAIFINLPATFLFFIKLHCIASMLNIKQFIKDLKSTPLLLIHHIFVNTMRSCCYWSIGALGGVRVCSCFNKKIIKILHYVFNRINKDNKEYEYVSERNLFVNLFITAIVGRYAILFETKGRRTEMTLVMIWYSLLQIIRMKCKLSTSDNDKYHWLLGLKSFVSFIFSLSVAINIYVYCKDVKYLKTMERNLIHTFLIN